MVPTVGDRPSWMKTRVTWIDTRSPTRKPAMSLYLRTGSWTFLRSSEIGSTIDTGRSIRGKRRQWTARTPRDVRRERDAEASPHVQSDRGSLPATDRSPDLFDLVFFLGDEEA